MNQFKIFHYYSKLTGFYGVRTKYSWREINLICAYLQLLRAELPCFQEVNDVLAEDDVVEILDSLYDCQKLVSDKAFRYDRELDLVDNWDDYAIGTNRQVINSIASVSGARVAILERMMIEAKKFMRTSNFSLAELETVERIEFIKSGKLVPSYWQLKPLHPNVIYTGSIDSGKKLDELAE